MSEENHETNEYLNKVIAYRASMSMVKELFEKEIITFEDYKNVSKMLAEEHHLDKDTIFDDSYMMKIHL
ncbi:MAG: hypothetical protein CW338_11560 [Clostridiales bacterium]|nr:hypothetical protein [Clostridiales bacterium]